MIFFLPKYHFDVKIFPYLSDHVYTLDVNELISLEGNSLNCTLEKIFKGKDIGNSKSNNTSTMSYNLNTSSERGGKVDKDDCSLPIVLFFKHSFS